MTVTVSPEGVSDEVALSGTNDKTYNVNCWNDFATIIFYDLMNVLQGYGQNITVVFTESTDTDATIMDNMQYLSYVAKYRNC